MYMPVQMSKYNELKDDFRKNNMPINWEIGMIEQASLFGFGTIGLENASGSWKIEEEFVTYKVIGDYKQMKDAYSKIRKDYPKSCNFYNLYLTDPNITKMEENITYIMFQVQE
jgi:hypothetical protein